MTTAAEKVAGNSYLLEELLIRLPAKSLARSKLVSKQWFSQISNPQFLQLHSRHRPNKLPTGMFLADFESICSDANFVSFNDLNPTYQTIPSLGFLYEGIKQLVNDNFFEIELLDSCNGLLLCLVTFGFTPSSPPKYCVCNPTTKKLRLLPPAPFSFSSFLDKDYLAFEPSLSLHYKVICTKESHNAHEMFIYSSQNQCWSTYASPFDPRGEWFFLNGSMYCAQSSLRFDVDTEKMEKMEQVTTHPSTVNCLRYYLLLTSSHVYCIIPKGANLLVLVMKSDFSEWVSKYDVSLTPLLSEFTQIVVSEEDFYSFHVISVVEGVKEDELDLVLGIPGKLILYNLKEKTAKELCKLLGELGDETGYRSACVYEFIECLFVV